MSAVLGGLPAAAPWAPPCAVGPRTEAELEAFGAEIRAVGERARARLGAADARYIRRLLLSIRLLESAGRALLALGPLLLPVWLLGAVLLGLSKILENMEFGHNVMHGQFDWLNDPRFCGHGHDWDNACSKHDWRDFHNHVHHHYTNVVGIDRDIGYGFVRLSAETPWEPRHLSQPIYAVIVAALFQWAIAIHNLELERMRTDREATQARVQRLWPRARAKMWRQFKRDYLAWPLLGGAIGTAVAAATGASSLRPADLAVHFAAAVAAVALGHALANVMRNLWSFVVIFCGHFPSGIAVFDEASLQGETKAGWYLRQVLGSGNIRGGRFLHLMTGNLSHQIEHHLYPDLPANRYGELAPEVERICAKYNVPYVTGSLWRQFGSVMWRIGRHAFPGGENIAVNLGRQRPA